MEASLEAGVHLVDIAMGHLLLSKSSAAIFKEKAKHSNFLHGHKLDHLPFARSGSK